MTRRFQIIDQFDGTRADGLSDAFSRDNPRKVRSAAAFVNDRSRYTEAGACDWAGCRGESEEFGNYLLEARECFRCDYGC